MHTPVHMNAVWKQKNTGLLTAFFTMSVSHSWLVILACKAHLFYAALACCHVSPDCTIFFHITSSMAQFPKNSY